MSGTSIEFTDEQVRQQIQNCLRRLVGGELFVQGFHEREFDALWNKNPDRIHKFSNLVADELKITRKRTSRAFFIRRMHPLLSEEISAFEAQKKQENGASTQMEIDHPNKPNGPAAPSLHGIKSVEDAKLLRTELEDNEFTIPTSDPTTAVKMQDTTQDSQAESIELGKVPGPESAAKKGEENGKKVEQGHRAGIEKGTNKQESEAKRAEEQEDSGDKRDEKAPPSELKKRRRSSASQPPRPRKKKGRTHVKFSEEERMKYAAELENEFLKEKEDTLGRLPESYKALFGQLAFCRWKKDPFRPVVVLSPYSVPPQGTMRDQWRTMFENTKGDPKRMWHWIFWYGSPLTEAFTWQKTQIAKEFVSYEEGVKRGLDKLDSKIQNKIDKGKKLTRSEVQVVAGYEALDEELGKKPEDRIPIPFKEIHETMLVMDDLVSLADTDVEGNEDDDDEDDSEDDLSEQVKEMPKMVKDKPRQKKGKPEKGVKETKAREKAIVNEDVGDADLSPDDDVHDDDEDSALVDSEDDDEADMDFDQETPKKRKISSSKSIPASKKLEKKDTTEKEEKQNKKKHKKTKDSSSGETDQKRSAAAFLRHQREREHNNFIECKELFDELVAELDNGIKEGDSEKVAQSMRKIAAKRIEEKMTAPYMEKSSLPSLVKSAKEAVKNNAEDLKIRKELYDRLRVVYVQKKKHVPEGWDKVKSDKAKTKTDKSEAKPASRPLLQQQLPSIPKTPREETKSGGDMEGKLEVEPPETSVKRSDSTGSAHVVIKHPPKKKISLTSLKTLLSKDCKPKDSDTCVSKAAAPQDPRKSMTPAEPAPKKLVEWLTKMPEPDPDFEQHKKRKLGQEFYRELSSCYFPSSTVNPEALAIALEQATYAWSQQQGSDWETAYWNKLHLVVGSIAGKHKAGFLLQDILAGKFATALDFVNLSEDALLESFEGMRGLFLKI